LVQVTLAFVVGIPAAIRERFRARRVGALELALSAVAVAGAMLLVVLASHARAAATRVVSAAPNFFA